MTWYAHQQKLLDENPTQKLVAFGCGGGKTRTILQLCKNQNAQKVLVIAPKTQVLDQTWERELKKIGLKLNLEVISKEQFKKRQPICDVLVIDESHFAVGVQATTHWSQKIEVPKVSQIYEAVTMYIETVKPRCVYLASATPFPQPMALYAVARMFGKKWDYFKFRKAFYFNVPTIGRGVWMPKKDEATKQLLADYAKPFGVFGRLQDFFDVPEQTHKEVFVGVTGIQIAELRALPLLYPEPLALISKRHQLEQGIFEDEMVEENKTGEIIELAREFDKILVFARYTKQIEHLERELKMKCKDHIILTLTGATVDRRALIERAERSNEKTIVIAQSQISTGYELPSFRCTVFASLSYSFVDYEQSLGRTLRANHLAKNVYVSLIAGEIDAAVLECVKDKRDFNELLFIESRHE